MKKSYQKLKEREARDGSDSAPVVAEKPATLELHPSRQAMLDEPEAIPEPAQPARQRRPPRPKPAPFKKEALLAQQRKEEREKRQEAIERANRERQAKAEERERFRRAMAEARSGGKNGQRKLGRESKVLLEKVQKMVNG